MQCILIQYKELPKSRNVLNTNLMKNYGGGKKNVTKTFDLNTQEFNTSSRH